MKAHNIWVLELAHNGRFLQEANLVFLRGLPVQHLDGNWQVPLLGVPFPTTHCTKLARTKVVLDPEGGRGEGILCSSHLMAITCIGISFSNLLAVIMLDSRRKGAKENRISLSTFVADTLHPLPT